jgi:hypothetical protein
MTHHFKSGPHQYRTTGVYAQNNKNGILYVNTTSCQCSKMPNAAMTGKPASSKTVTAECYDWFIWKQYTTIFQTQFLEYLMFHKSANFVFMIKKSVI